MSGQEESRVPHLLLTPPLQPCGPAPPALPRSARPQSHLTGRRAWTSWGPLSCSSIARSTRAAGPPAVVRRATRADTGRRAGTPGVRRQLGRLQAPGRPPRARSATVPRPAVLTDSSCAPLRAVGLPRRGNRLAVRQVTAIANSQSVAHNGSTGSWQNGADGSGRGSPTGGAVQ